MGRGLAEVIPAQARAGSRNGPDGAVGGTYAPAGVGSDETAAAGSGAAGFAARRRAGAAPATDASNSPQAGQDRRPLGTASWQLGQTVVRDAMRFPRLSDPDPTGVEGSQGARGLRVRPVTR